MRGRRDVTGANNVKIKDSDIILIKNYVSEIDISRETERVAPLTFSFTNLYDVIQSEGRRDVTGANNIKITDSDLPLILEI